MTTNIQFNSLRIMLLAGLLLVVPSLQAQYFTKRIGDDSAVEGATAIVDDNRGNMLVAGFKNYHAVLTLVSNSGNIIWSKEMKITEGLAHRDVIYDMEIHEDYVIACGYGDYDPDADQADPNGDVLDHAFVFRLNLNNQTVDWTRVDNSETHLSRWYSISRYKSTFLLTGGLHTNPVDPNDPPPGTEAYVRTLTEWGTLTNFEGPFSTSVLLSDDMQYSEIHDGSLYVGGRVFADANSGGSGGFGGLRYDDPADDPNIDNAGVCYSRAMATSIAPTSGVVNWANQYFAAENAQTRMYGIDLTIGHNELINVGNQLFHNECSSPHYLMYINRTDFNGNVIQERNFKVAGEDYDITFGREVVKLSDGYLVVGQAGVGDDSDFFLMKFDFNLQVIWTRIYGGIGADDFAYNSNTQLVVDEAEDAIWFVGSSKGYGNPNIEDMVVYKTDLNGTISAECQVEGFVKQTDTGPVEVPFTWGEHTLIPLHLFRTIVPLEITPPGEATCGCLGDG